MIDSYSFGNMVINGEKYTSDLIIYPDSIDDNWYRKKGHMLQEEDLDEIISHNTDALIIGTGAYGAMKIPDPTKKFLESKNIELIAQKTGKAYKTFNNLRGKRKVIAAFHLTC